MIKKRIILAGAGRGHLFTIKKIPEMIKMGYEIAVINPDRFHYFYEMIPGLISGTYSEENCRIDIKTLTIKNGGIFIEDLLKEINWSSKYIVTEKGRNIGYDVLSLNLGSGLKDEFRSRKNNIINIKPASNISGLIKSIKSLPEKSPSEIFIIGGSFHSMEYALNLREFAVKNNKSMHITLSGNSRTETRQPQNTVNRFMNELNKREIVYLENLNIKKISGSTIHTDSSKFKADLIINCSDTAPSEILKKQDLATGNEGSLLVNSFLQSRTDPSIFGVGSCIEVDGILLSEITYEKESLNRTVYNNIISHLKHGKLVKYIPKNRRIDIFNTGFNSGVLTSERFTFAGRIPYFIRNRRDLAFIKDYQSWK